MNTKQKSNTTVEEVVENDEVVNDRINQKRVNKAAEKAAKMAGVDPKALRKLAHEIADEIATEMADDDQQDNSQIEESSKCKCTKKEKELSWWDDETCGVSNKAIVGTVATAAAVGIGWYVANKYVFNDYETDSSTDDFGF